MARTPDVLVIVLDCVRADSFPGMDEGRIDAPYLRALLRSSRLWNRAVSVAPWTRPAHASLFSGRYPWEHGCHTKGVPALPPNAPHLAADLHRAGYTTLGVSANPQIAPSTGLAGGFDRMAWGRWGERVALRQPTDQAPYEARDVALAAPVEPTSRGWSRVRYVRAVVQHRQMWLSALGLRTAEALRRDRPRPRMGDLCPWVEPTLERFLREAEADRPVFGFVNLLDAHEPYFPQGDDLPSARDWWRFSRIPQDHFGYVAGRNPMDPKALASLRRAYDRQITRLDRRVRTIVESWERLRGGERLWLAITSDHGQAFGERGAIFHSILPDDVHLRIPLLIRDGNRPGGDVASERVSLLDLYATVRSVTGLTKDLGSAGAPLDAPVDTRRTLLAASDGLASGFPFDSLVDRSRREALDRVYAVAYSDGTKLWRDAGSGQESGYALDSDPREEHPIDPEKLGVPPRARLATATAARQMLAGASTLERVGDRLAGWGYYR